MLVARAGSGAKSLASNEILNGMPSKSFARSETGYKSRNLRNMARCPEKRSTLR